MANEICGLHPVFGGVFNVHRSNIPVHAFGGDNQVLAAVQTDEPNVFGGILNCIHSGQYNTILGGARNTLTGNHNAILGGVSNNDGGHNYVGIFGCNVTALMDNAFHANTYFVNNMPDSTGFPIACQLYYCICVAGPGGCCFVYIR